MKKKEKFLDYKGLIKKSLISVIKHALEKTTQYGLTDNHHFYITFNTTYSKNVMPKYLNDDYPETMMIVIENEFWNLKVFDEYFLIDLKFKGKVEHLKIFFASLKSFVDPSVSFTLNLEIDEKKDSKKISKPKKLINKKQIENKSNVIFLNPDSK